MGILVFGVLGFTSYVFPVNGIAIGDKRINFPSLQTLFESNGENDKIKEALGAFNSIDTSFAILKPGDDVKKSSKPIALITSLQYTDKNAMRNFYDALSGLAGDPKAIRVLHYGDSQIEGDRMTDFIRQKFQQQFGGTGPGLVSLMPVTSSIINRISNGPGWDRYNVFTARDKRVAHNNYGVLAGFNRFCGYRKITDTASVFTSSVGIITTENGGESAMLFKKVKLFYGGAQKKTWCEFYDGPVLSSADSLEAGGYFNVKEYPVSQGFTSQTFKFRGKDSPDFYAVSLEGDEGVMVDNIGLRGSSGTFFHQVNNAQLKQFYDYLNVKLIILQFGGNSLPGIKNDTMANNFGDYMRYQVSIIKKIAPNASILFIGPSDMSVKKGTAYVTHPYLETMRDALKKTMLKNGCAYFDLYDCMGGRNSMPVWVEQKLAGADYTHLSPQGARRIAAMLYAALIEDYNKYLKENK